MTKFKKIFLWLIVTMIAMWIIFTESPYQKGGISPLFTLIIPCFVMLLSTLIALFYNTFHLLERLIVSLVIGLTVLFIVSFIITPYFIDHFYNDKTWFLWETKHRLFINAVYYGLNVSFLTVLIHLYFKFRRQISRNKTNTITSL
jgi:hypothetical protein